MAGDWTVRRAFSKPSLDQIEAAIAAGEMCHGAEICIAVEHSLPVWDVLVFDKSPRARAVEVFSDLHVWDTEANNGVLVYLLLADRDVEVLADRGAAACVPQSEWQTACETIRSACRDNEAELGLRAAVAQLSQVLARHFPPGPRNDNELPDRPTLL